jgi:integrase
MTKTPTPRERRPRRQTLSDKQIAALERRATTYFHPDPELPKHGVRVRPAGPGSYTVIVRDPYGKQRWVKIGSTAEMTVAEARALARTVIKRVEAGLDPFEPPPVKPNTVADVIATYLKRHVEARGLRTGDEVRRVLDGYVLPHWRDRVFAEVRRSDVAKLLDAIEDKHGPWVADHTLSALRGVASWYAARDDSYLPPFTRNMRRVAQEARKRSRILSDDELRRVWQAASEAATFGALVKLSLLCGQRREKVASMRWSDISPDGVWTIRTAAREKGNPGSLVLPKLALDIIAAQPRFASNPHVFAGISAGATNNFGRAKKSLDEASGVTGWTLHDLRRSARSLLSRAGVRPDLAARVLGHAIAGVEGVYDRHSYDLEKADALRRLATLIERIVNPPEGNVVPMLPEAAAS